MKNAEKEPAVKRSRAGRKTSGHGIAGRTETPRSLPHSRKAVASEPGEDPPRPEPPTAAEPGVCCNYIPEPTLFT